MARSNSVNQGNRIAPRVKEAFPSLALVIPAALLLVVAVILRARGGDPFYAIETFPLAAHVLTEDTPSAGPVLRFYLNHFFADYFLHYIVPCGVLFAPAVILGALGLARFSARLDDFQQRFALVRDTKWTPLLLSVAAFIAVVLSHFLVLHHYPWVTDEYSYVFQAEVLKAGRLVADSPPFPDAFSTLNVVNDGAWYSRFTIGWPLLLAAGQVVGLNWLPGALCAALCVFFVHRIVRRLVDAQAALFAAGAALLSPFFFVLGGTYFPHTAAACCTLMGLHFLIDMEERRGWFAPAMAGLATGALLLIRPGDGAITSLGLLPFVVHAFFRSRARGAYLAKVAMVAAGAGVGVLLLLLVNKQQTGDYFMLAYSKYQAAEMWGFGRLGHTPLKGLYNTLYASMRIAFWSVPFVSVLAALSLFTRDRRMALLLVPPLVLTLFFAGFYTLGDINIGSRFYLAAFLVLLIPASAGLAWCRDRLQRWSAPAGRIGVPVFVLGLTLFMIGGVYVPFLPRLAREYERYVGYSRWVAAPPELAGPSIIFFADDPLVQNAVFTRNTPDYERQQQLRVLYLDPDENLALIEKFPGRKLYTASYNPQAQRYAFQEGVDNSRSAHNYLLAGMNYWHGVLNMDKAERSLLRARAQGEDPEILLALGRFYVDRSAYAKAAAIFEKLARIPGDDEVSYLLGRALGEMGRREEGIAVLQRYRAIAPNRFMEAKALEWIRFYQTAR